MRSVVVAAAVLACTVGAGLAVAHNKQTLWFFREQVDHMDDSVWRFVIASADEEGDTWFAMVECDNPRRLSLHNDSRVSKSERTMRVRFDKSRPIEYEVLWFNERAFYFETNFFGDRNLASMMLTNVLLRVEFPRRSQTRGHRP